MRGRLKETKDSDPVIRSADTKDENVGNYEDHFYSESGQQSHQPRMRLKTPTNRSTVRVGWNKLCESHGSVYVGVKSLQFKVDIASGSDEDLGKDINGAKEPNLPHSMLGRSLIDGYTSKVMQYDLLTQGMAPRN